MEIIGLLIHLGLNIFVLVSDTIYVFKTLTKIKDFDSGGSCSEHTTPDYAIIDENDNIYHICDYTQMEQVIMISGEKIYEIDDEGEEHIITIDDKIPNIWDMSVNELLKRNYNYITILPLIKINHNTGIQLNYKNNIETQQYIIMEFVKERYNTRKNITDLPSIIPPNNLEYKSINVEILYLSMKEFLSINEIIIDKYILKNILKLYFRYTKLDNIILQCPEVMQLVVIH
jgi:hypothetical protein